MKEHNELKTEYLVVVSTKDSFCNDNDSFKNLLKSNSDIEIDGNKIIFNSLEINYKLQSDDMNEKDKKYYHIKLICKDINKINEFEKLLRNIRVILGKVSTKQIETLWDDVSFYYATKSYPIIHEIENLMRKLITKFMLANVGVGWTKVHVPDDVKENIKNKGKVTSDYLYQTDFIKLSNFLFDEYQTQNIDKLYLLLDKLENKEDLDIENLKSFIPKSNWERYFSEIVDCENTFLEKRWEQLYDLRCNVAHNNKVSKDDYERLNELSKEVKDILKSAINNLDKIKISNEEKENIAENVVMKRNELYGEFINNYKKLLELINEKYDNKDLKHINNYKIFKKLYYDKNINRDIYSQIKFINNFRNKIVHENNINVDDEKIYLTLNLLKKYIYLLKNDMDLNEAYEICEDCGIREGVYPLSTGGSLCEICSQESGKYDYCSSCGRFFPRGELKGTKCDECQSDI